MSSPGPTVLPHRALSPLVREALDALPDAVSIVDYGFHLLYVNRKAADFLRHAGVNPQAVIGQLFWDALPSARDSEWEHGLRRAAASRAEIVFARYAPALGRWTETRMVPSETVITTYSRDMSEPHEAERRAAESSSLLHAILNNTTDAIFVKDLEERYLAINEAGAAALHRTVAEVIGRTNHDFLPADIADVLRARELAVIDTGESTQREDVVHIGAARRWYLASRGVWRDAHGAIAGVVGIAKDITARRRREEANLLLADAGRALAESLDFRTTLNAVAQLVVPAIADWCMVVLKGEGGWLETLAIAHADPERQRLAREDDARHPIDPDGPTGIAGVIRTGQSALFEETTPELHADAARTDEYLTVLRAIDIRSVMIVPMQVRGRILGAMAMFLGESGRRFSAQDLPVAEELARRSAMAIENAELFSAAAAANRVKSEFLASMSHELRTPLNAVLGYTQLLAEGITGPVTPAQQEQLLRIRGSAAHLLGLIDEVLSFSRMEAGREQVTLQEVDVSVVVDEAASLSRPMAAMKGLPLVIELAAHPILLFTDLLKLRQILVNLAANAVKFTDTGYVSVGVTMDGPDVVFEVRDTGIGISPAYLERVFEPFWQVEQSAARRVGGTGLGLSISRRFARLLGGELTVTSTLGQGSIFALRLPLAPLPPR